MENLKELGFNEISKIEKAELNGGIIPLIIAYIYREEIKEAVSDFTEGFKAGFN